MSRLGSLEVDIEAVRSVKYLLGSEPVNGNEKQDWAESAVSLCDNLAKPSRSSEHSLPIRGLLR